MPGNAGPCGEAPGSGGRQEWQGDAAGEPLLWFSQERQGRVIRFMIGKFEYNFSQSWGSGCLQLSAT